ncbi:glycoside hydrolase family 43 protein [Rhinopithecimicrobium faecis]
MKDNSERIMKDSSERNNFQGHFFRSLIAVFSVWFCSIAAASGQELIADRAQDSVYGFSYFKDNGADGLHLAYSYDGLQWHALKGDQSFLKPELSADKLMRDPCIIRGADGIFHMVWTVSWTARGIGYAHSRDLIHWSPQQYIPVMEHEAKARNTWAPEITYDAQKAEYLIYWATTITGHFPETFVSADNGYNHRIYAVTTKDFKHFSSTFLLYEPGFNVIDSHILRQGDRWLMFLKDETREPAQKNLKIAFAENLAGPYSAASAPISNELWAEGPTAVYREGAYWLYYDRYIDHHYALMRSADLTHWEDLTPALKMPLGIRHGTIFKLSTQELAKLQSL